MAERLPTISETDWLPDAGLEAIEALIPKMPQDFTIDINAYAKTVQVTFRFERPDSVMRRAESIHPLLEAAMCVDTLCKNLRAERESRGVIGRGDGPKGDAA